MLLDKFVPHQCLGFVKENGTMVWRYVTEKAKYSIYRGWWTASHNFVNLQQLRIYDTDNILYLTKFEKLGLISM